MIQDWEHRREEDRLLIERLLIIIRNILHVPPNVTQELVRARCSSLSCNSNLKLTEFLAYSQLLKTTEGQSFPSHLPVSPSILCSSCPLY